MLNIVLFGPPGAGKGTQSRKLIEKYNLVHLSTGDLLREEISHGTELGLRARAIMDRGELVSDDIVIGMIEARLDSNAHSKGFIFDGFPRTQAQAEALDDLLQKKGTAISAMLALEVSDDELTKRLLLRGKESGRPDDQDEEIIRNRVNEYNNKTLPLKNYYSEQGKFHAVKGVGTIDEIFDALCDRITFVQAEIELTNLENDIEHLDLTINDFEVATEISPELQKDMDEVRNLDKQPKAEKEDQHKPKGIVERIKETVNHFFHRDEDPKGKAPAGPAKKAAAKPAKKTAAPGKKVAAPAKKASAPAKKSVKKAVKKSAPKKVAVKKSAPKKAVKPLKKAAKKATPKKQLLKKAVTKAAPKKAGKKVLKPVKKAVKKAVKKPAPKKLAKKAMKKVMKPLAKKAAVKKKPLKKAIKAAVKKSAPKKKTAPKKALKKAVKKKK